MQETATTFRLTRPFRIDAFDEAVAAPRRGELLLRPVPRLDFGSVVVLEPAVGIGDPLPVHDVHHVGTTRRRIGRSDRRRARVLRRGGGDEEVRQQDDGQQAAHGGSSSGRGRCGAA